MSDLISRSALIEMIDNDIDMTKRFIDKITNPLEMASRNYIALSSQLNTLKSFRTIIAEQPTVYDVENVVAELEEMRDGFSKDSILAQGLSETAIDIVRNGGKE